jgi:hypothetical protein
MCVYMYIYIAQQIICESAKKREFLTTNVTNQICPEQKRLGFLIQKFCFCFLNGRSQGFRISVLWFFNSKTFIVTIMQRDNIQEESLFKHNARFVKKRVLFPGCLKHNIRFYRREALPGKLTGTLHEHGLYELGRSSLERSVSSWRHCDVFMRIIEPGFIPNILNITCKYSYQWYYKWDFYSMKGCFEFSITQGIVGP